MEQEAQQRRDSEAAALEAAVAAVHPRAWEEAEGQRRVGTRLLVRLRVEEGRRMALRACEVERGAGREAVPVEEERFQRMLRAALVRRAWGWSGDVVVVLRRDEVGWWDEDSVHTVSPARVARTPEPSRTRPGTGSSEAWEPSSTVSILPSASPDLGARGHEDGLQAERWKAVEAKLEEYLQWGMRLMETHAAHLRRIAPGNLITEHPLREKSLDALVRATLAWAYAHTDDPDFLRRSPSEVAL